MDFASTPAPHAPSDTPTESTVNFASLALGPTLLEALRDEGYETPTPIQARAIPPVLAGRDVLGCAQTGTGKTAAFALPILHRLLQQPADKLRRGSRAPRALILSPTRELATQISESFATYGRHTGLEGTTVFGGVSQFHQVRALHRGIDILVATPGRLLDLMEQGFVNLREIEIFVLDEADRMLDMGFIQPIRQIARAIPTERQTLLFSATMPREIQSLADSMLRNPVRVAVTPAATAVPLIEQSLYMVPRMMKPALLEHLLAEQEIERAVVFTKTKHGADKLMKRLLRSGVSAQAIHGNKAQSQRTRALDAFRAGRSRVLVATDVAARGLDVDGITHVFNFDLPMEPEAYVHRIGRTGRAGATGIAISFCDGEERGLLRDIERLMGKKIPLVPKLPNLPAPTETPRESYDQDRAQAANAKPARGWGSERSRRDDRPGAGAGHHERRGYEHVAAASDSPARAAGSHDRARNGYPTGKPVIARAPARADQPESPSHAAPHANEQARGFRAARPYGPFGQGVSSAASGEGTRSHGSGHHPDRGHGKHPQKISGGRSTGEYKSPGKAGEGYGPKRAGKPGAGGKFKPSAKRSPTGAPSGRSGKPASGGRGKFRGSR